MADMKFDCPKCAQAISCDELWSGHEIQCPSCQAGIVVPAKPEAAAPAGQAAPRLSIGRSQQQSASHAAAKSTSAPPPTRRPGPATSAGGSPAWLKWVKITAVVAVLGVGAYFGITYLLAYQEKVNAERRKIEKNSDGGEIGHTMELNSVLDATDPDKHSSSRRASLPDRQTTSPRPIPLPSAGSPGAAPAADAALVAPAYSLEAAGAVVPQSRVNGTLSGTNFVAEVIRLDPNSTAKVLRFTQGSMLAPDREILIYLHPKAGEKLAGRSWTISKDQAGTDVPLVMKRWKANPRAALQSKSFPTGYSMKLEFGQFATGTVDGQIFLALPDTEQSVIGGVFKAQTTLLDGAPPAAAVGAPGTAPVGPSPAEKAAFDKRYGIKRP